MEGFFKPYFWIAAIAAAALAAGHVLLNKRNPRGVALWLGIILAIPIIGPLLYWLLGINRVWWRGESRARKKSIAVKSEYPDDYLASVPPTTHFLKSLPVLTERATQRPLLANNSITPLYEGNEVFPAMLEAIGGAKRTIRLSTYILDRDAVGLRVIDSLCSAAKRGIDVHVLVDGFGTSRSAIKMARRLRKAGAHLAIFHPIPKLPFRSPSINMRNHRKILVIDGLTGFTGGINITSRHFFSQIISKKHVRDVHFRVQGPIVNAMDEVFTEDWAAATGTIIENEALAPMVEGSTTSIRAVASGPDENFEKIYEIVLGALKLAEKNVIIMTPYFIPDRAVIQSLRSAVLAGVNVRIMLPSESDQTVVQLASMAYMEELIESGVEIVLVRAPFIHSKLMVVDGTWSLIGSANLDPRSFRLNFEFDLEVYSEELAEELISYADSMAVDSEVLTAEKIRSKPLWIRLLEGTAKIFSPFL